MSASKKSKAQLPIIHPQAIVDPAATIGKRTRIWQFVLILGEARVGDDCNICAQCLIETGVIIGSRVTIKSGVQLWTGINLEDETFIGPNVTFANDPYPRSKQYLAQYPKTIVERGASIGGNATILPGVRIGKYSMVGAGSVVTSDVPANAIVYGNPARLKGWICSCGQKITKNPNGNTICKCSSIATKMKGNCQKKGIHNPIGSKRKGYMLNSTRRSSAEI